MKQVQVTHNESDWSALVEIDGQRLTLTFDHEPTAADFTAAEADYYRQRPLESALLGWKGNQDG